MHLCPEKEYNFHLFAQSYDFFYSHGSTNSGGVCIAVKWNSVIKVMRCGEIKGHLLALDVELSMGSIRIVGIYAPPIASPRFRRWRIFSLTK